MHHAPFGESVPRGGGETINQIEMGQENKYSKMMRGVEGKRAVESGGRKCWEEGS